MTQPVTTDNFLERFKTGSLAAAEMPLQREPLLAQHDGYKAHPLLRDFVASNGGHCHRPDHLAIADLLIPLAVRTFRDAVLDDRISDVRNLLEADPDLVGAEFTAGRGIAQAIHHWRSVAIGEFLLDSGADIDARTTLQIAGETALVTQLRFGTVDGVRLLLSRGADPNCGVLKFMPSDTMPVLVTLLIEHGWDINEGAGTRTLLHHDANHGHGKKVRILLDHGADPNARDGAGQTALHLIASRGVGKEAIRALVKVGADIDSRDDQGQSPLDLARQAKRPAAAEELIGLGAE